MEKPKFKIVKLYDDLKIGQEVDTKDFGKVNVYGYRELRNPFTNDSIYAPFFIKDGKEYLFTENDNGDKNGIGVCNNDDYETFKKDPCKYIITKDKLNLESL